MRLTKHLLVAFFCSLIISCSLVKTSYNNAPALVIWWLDDYFNFTSAQQVILKPSLQKLHQWHRQHQLPHYLTQLQDMQALLAKEQISADEVCTKLDVIKQSLHTLRIESIPIIIQTAPLLSDKQLNRFQKKLGERNEKWKSDWWQETKEAQTAARLEKAQDFAEKVYGDLNDAQINLIEQSIMQAEFNPALAYNEVLRRNEDVFKILSKLQKNNLNEEEKSQLIKTGFESLQKSPNAIYQTHADRMKNNSCETMADLHASTTAKQKLHAKNWLNDYTLQITDLQTKLGE